jgi:hypothetical protein
MSTLEVLSYLTDSTFMSVVAIGVALVVSLNFIDRIGGRK